ncbi:MAG: hypothetical protein M1835_005513 [Candelina submexicana]|nr:MAG: hypothetical protein M1835_005513 [Candelina submexicana]
MATDIIQDPPTSTLIFSTASSNFSKTLTDIKRSSLSIPNRLRSLQQDSKFVLSVADTFNLPLIANERCGGWYIPPERKASSAYFKSTDGHTGQWKFSLRRLNLHVLDVVAEHGGCIIADSARRGKSMPDALSKTIPIWCCVLNRVFFPKDIDTHQLYTPHGIVSNSEHSQIEGFLGGFVKRFQDLHLPLPVLRQTFTKPLRPVWVRPETALSTCMPINANKSNVVILCTASRCHAPEDWYIQGAGDDGEGWAHGLTADLYWANKEMLMRTPEGELEGSIAQLVASAGRPTDLGYTLINPTTGVYVGTSAAATAAAAASYGEADFDLIIDCSPVEKHGPPDQVDPQKIGTKVKAKSLTLPCGTGKLGSRALRKELPHAADFIAKAINDVSSDQEQSQGLRILATCPTATDLAVGVALMEEVGLDYGVNAERESVKVDVAGC